MNKMPQTTKVAKNDPVFSNSVDAMGVPDSNPMPITTADNPKAFVNLSSPNNFTNRIGRRALKNAERKKKIIATCKLVKC